MGGGSIFATAAALHRTLACVANMKGQIKYVAITVRVRAEHAQTVVQGSWEAEAAGGWQRVAVELQITKQHLM